MPTWHSDSPKMKASWGGFNEPVVIWRQAQVNVITGYVSYSRVVLQMYTGSKHCDYTPPPCLLVLDIYKGRFKIL